LQLKPVEFWELTPVEFSIMVDGYVRNQRNKQNDLLSLAWHTQAFARYKKLPNLKNLLLTAKPNKPKEPQTPEVMIAQCKMLNAAFGGAEVET